MSLYVLDTDMLSLFQKGHPAVCQRCAAAPPQSVTITIITVEEQFLGWYTRGRQAKTDAELARASDGIREDPIRSSSSMVGRCAAVASTVTFPGLLTRPAFALSCFATGFSLGGAAQAASYRLAGRCLPSGDSHRQRSRASLPWPVRPFP
jgi:tRNA(fMet)-specific endonuclease VapC